MATRSFGHVRIVSESKRSQLLPNGVLGMGLFVITEAMLFAGLISAFTIIRAGAPVWPPYGQPRLPAGETAINTVALLASGVALFLAHRRLDPDPRRAQTPLLVAISLGAFFVLFQGVEWLALLGRGLTVTSSSLGSFFYLIIGIHALHAVVALALLVHTWLRLRGGWLGRGRLMAAEVLWYFVVGIWPVIYGVVYL